MDVLILKRGDGRMYVWTDRRMKGRMKTRMDERIVYIGERKKGSTERKLENTLARQLLHLVRTQEKLNNKFWEELMSTFL
jgi:hypothetical protein